MATRRDFTLSVGSMDLKCFLNGQQEVVVIIDDCTGDYMSVNICDREDLEQLIIELDNLKNKMKAL